MNETDRKTLVRELTQAQHDAWPGVDADFTVNTDAIMPIIERYLAAAAAPEPDELLDSVHDGANIEFLVWDEESGFDGDDRHEGEWVTRIVWPLAARWEPLVDVGSAEGTGPTRMDAIKAAVAQATGTTQEGSSDE